MAVKDIMKKYSVPNKILKDYKSETFIPKRHFSERERDEFAVGFARWALRHPLGPIAALDLLEEYKKTMK